MRFATLFLPLALLVLAAGQAPPPTTSPALTLTRTLAAQRIPVARLSAPYEFTIARDTATAADGGEVQYAAVGTPSWLDFAGRTFSGTPRAGQDLGTYNVTVIAKSPSSTGVDGSLTDFFTLVATIDPAPIITNPVTAQLIPNATALASVYPYVPGSAYYPGVRIPRGWSFSIGLDAGTVTSPAGRAVSYTAQRKDGSALPSWLVWNEAEYTFSGVAPVQPSANPAWTPPGPDVYEIALGASDREGYWDLEQTFSIIVADNDFQAGPGGLGLNVSAGYPMWPAEIFALGDITYGSRSIFDAYAPQPEPDISVNTTNVPWLTYDPLKRLFSGSAPVTDVGGSGGSFVLKAVSSSNESLVATVPILVFPWAFTSAQLPDIQNGANGTISIDVRQYLSNKTGAIEIALGYYTSSWLRVEDWRLYGTRPKGSRETAAYAHLVATDVETHAFSWAALTINMTEPLVDRPAPPTSPRGLSRAGKIALAVCFGLVALLALIIMLVLLVKLHKNRKLSRRRSLSMFWNFADAPEDSEKRSSNVSKYWERDSAFGPLSERAPTRGGLRARMSRLSQRASAYFAWGGRPAPRDRKISSPFALSPNAFSYPGIGIGQPGQVPTRHGDMWYEEGPPTGGNALSRILEVSEPSTIRAVPPVHRPTLAGRPSAQEGLDRVYGSSAGHLTSADSLISLYSTRDGARPEIGTAEPFPANWGAMAARLEKPLPPADVSEEGKYADVSDSAAGHPGGAGSDQASSPGDRSAGPHDKHAQTTPRHDRTPRPRHAGPAPDTDHVAAQGASDSAHSLDSEPSMLVHAQRIPVPPLRLGAIPPEPTSPTPTSRQTGSSTSLSATHRSSRAGWNTASSSKPRVVADMRLVI